MAIVGGLATAAVLSACAGSRPPSAGEARGYVPSLVGQKVVVFPVQRNLGVGGDATSEMVFALEGPGAGPEWIFPDEVQAVMERSPALSAPLRDLPVDVFLQAEVRRIGDPIYGILRRIGAVTDAGLALMPVAVRPGARAIGADGAVDEGPVPVEFVAALLEIRTGRVLWLGVEAGRAGDADDPGRLASAAEALARRLVPPRAGGDGAEVVR